MKTRLLIIIGIVIAVWIIVGVMMILPNDPDKIIDPSSFEYLRALQNLCKQNGNSGSVSMVDGPRWQNATHYFDVPGCEFVPLIISEHASNLEYMLIVPAHFVEFTEDGFAEITIPYKIQFQENLGGDE